jgi:signal transduction histidine kinase/CheY-like chemotaxis protein
LGRYGFACGAVLCAALLTPLLGPYLEPVPHALLVAAVLASAWYGGVGPGLLTILLMLVAIPLVLGPQPPPGGKGLAGLGIFVLMTGLLGWQSSGSRRARAALRLLADAGKSLGTSFEYEARLVAAARVALPEFADAGAVDLLDEGGRLRCAAAAHSDPVLEEKLRLAFQCQAPSSDAPGGVAGVARSGQPIVGTRLSDALLAELVPEGPRRQALRALGVRSLLIVPLRARGQTLGALTLLSARRTRRYRRADLVLAEELARRAAVAIDNARLYREARDMEEALRRRAEQLAAADRTKDEFIAIVAHELRGPLAALRGALEVLRLQGAGEVTADAPQAIMARQVGALARLVDDLLDVPRITQGKIDLRRQPLDLARVLHAAVDTTRPLLDERRHTLTLALPLTPVRIDADPGRLEQVFVNLLTNAAKYTEPGGHVRLSAAVEEGPGGPPRALVSVRDTGVGMAPEFLARAFELFTQGVVAPGHARGGLGIGLALARRLVAMHGGTVEAHSDGPGQGSEFVVRLPLLSDGAEPSPPAAVRRPPSTRRILVVDDNADAAESLALLLRQRGHDVRLAGDGPGGLALAGEHPPEVVLLDLGLPGMSGHEVARRLRRQPGLNKALIVALTGSGSDEDRELSRQCGCDHFLVKPVDWDELAGLLGGP